MRNILALDPGTNSLGTFLRNPNIDGSIIKQTEYFSVDIFKSGVNSDEYSFAADRSKSRGSRVLYERRRYRKWATLKLLIEYGMCPLTNDELEKWTTYDKSRGLKREYPTDAEHFERWIRLDFDNDGKPDYTSPYQLRRELVSRQFDFTQIIERYKLGRALYHIAQRRGFKSSKGETLKEMEQLSLEGDSNLLEEEYTLKNSEQKKSGPLVEYKEKHELKTVGCAFAQLEDEGVRIRGSIYQAVRSLYREEIDEIFKYQEGLEIGSDLWNRLVSMKKGEGSIFYKCPLKSQKHNVGYCKLETKKTRCPISHPVYEEFRAWSFINTIKYRVEPEAEWQELPLYIKNAMYEEKFCSRVKVDFKFEELRKFIEERLSIALDNKQGHKTINYKDNHSVSGCPVTVRIKHILGDDWGAAIICGTKIRNKGGVEYKATYSAYDLWNICYNAEDLESLELFAERTLGWFGEQKKRLIKLWDTIQEGYAMLSMKAMQNINYFLRKGLIYSDAVALAKIPECLGESLYQDHEEEIINHYINAIKPQRRYDKLIKSIVNNLISRYKCLSIDEGEMFAFKDASYKIVEDDKKQCEHVAKITIGFKSWKNKSEEEKGAILKDVESLYQEFFSNIKREYFKLDKELDMLKNYLKKEFSGGDIDVIDKVDSLYHHSDIVLSASPLYTDQGILQLPSPSILPIKNPAVMRVLNIMRNKINNLLSARMISPEETRVVVENTRVMNDANMRKAIELYQKSRDDEYKEINKILNEVLGTKDHEYSKDEKSKVRLFLEQPLDDKLKKKYDGISDEKLFSENVKKNIAKYKLWKEQGCMCLYTGEIINLSNLFSNDVDFEHTIPRSLSFDDSFSNLTVCKSHFNRFVKNNRIPSDLDNYEEIIQRLGAWKKRVEKLKDNVNHWVMQAHKALTKERKDFCIVQKHLWKMELDYWERKLQGFTCKEVTAGFRNRQLVDTGIVTKYAAIYLKTVFKHVEVQKGEVTAIFRKIFGVQGSNEQKDRTLHSHHAVDAAVLSMIPAPAMRERILELYYKCKESLGNDKLYYSRELDKTIRELGLSKNCDEVRGFIAKKLIVTHHKNDRALLHAIKKRRHNGRVVCCEDQNVKRYMYSKGDSIRGKINKETFYGAVCLDGKIRYVVRRELKFKSSSIAPGFKDWEDLEKSIVDKSLVKMMQGQFPAGTSFREACEQGIYTIRKSDNRRLARMRHVRCFATTVTNPIKLKKQTYLSKKEYKQYVYTQSGDLYTMVKYSNKHKTIFVPYSLWDISENRKVGKDDIPSIIYRDKMEFTKGCSLVLNDMLLLYGKNENPLRLSEEEIINRLYVVKGFEKTGCIIKLVQHICAKGDTELGKGESVKNWKNLPEKIRCGISTINFLILGVDFEFDVKTNKVRFGVH